MVVLRNHGKKKALHHCGNYCTTISFQVCQEQVQGLPGMTETNQTFTPACAASSSDSPVLILQGKCCRIRRFQFFNFCFSAPGKDSLQIKSLCGANINPKCFTNNICVFVQNISLKCIASRRRGSVIYFERLNLPLGVSKSKQVQLPEMIETDQTDRASAVCFTMLGITLLGS